jgi:hypothetical protein
MVHVEQAKQLKLKHCRRETKTKWNQYEKKKKTARVVTG